MGRGVSQDIRGAVASAGRAEDQLRRMARLRAMSAAELAEILGGDPAAALPWVEAAAACGIAGAQLRLGRMLLDGTGIAQDQAAALRWFGKAALAGVGDAQNMVGRCHELGWGTPEDWGTAVHWYQRAAASGDIWGIYNLANMLFDGRGVTEDRAEAVGLYEKAARAGHARAMNLLGRCLEEAWGTARDPAGAAGWYRRSAAGGYFRGQYNHGIELLRQGRRDEAAALFARAAAEADPAMRERMAALLGEHRMLSQIGAWRDSPRLPGLAVGA